MIQLIQEITNDIRKNCGQKNITKTFAEMD